jgi:hypothetical protein
MSLIHVFKAIIRTTIIISNCNNVNITFAVLDVLYVFKYVKRGNFDIVSVYVLSLFLLPSEKCAKQNILWRRLNNGNLEKCIMLERQ